VGEGIAPQGDRVRTPDDLIADMPEVYVIARSSLDNDALTRYFHDRDHAASGTASWRRTSSVDTELLVEFAGRTCYDSFGKKQGRTDSGDYLRNILLQSHGSVLEHASYTFLITNVSRSLTHELVRHRAGWAFSQESQRYVDESDTTYVLPPLIADAVESGAGSARERWLGAISVMHEAYGDLAMILKEEAAKHGTSQSDRRKLSREAARSVLPNATSSTIVATANIRAIRHFLEMRGGEGADAEMRRFAFALLVVMQAEAPLLFGDYQIVGGQGREYIHTPHRKV